MSHVKVLSSNMRGLVIRTIGAVQSAFSLFFCFSVISLCILFIAIVQLLYRSCWVLIGLLPLCSPCNHHPHASYLFLECEGLVKPPERRETFRWQKLKNYGLFFQEVYCTKEKESIWTSEWGFTAIFNCFSSANTSVCMLFKITFNSKESDNILIKKGHLLLIIDVKTDNKVITLGKNVPPIKTSLP